MVSFSIYEANGDVAIGPANTSISPNVTVFLFTPNNTARHCVVEVTKGGKRNTRVSLEATDSNFDPIAAVAGQ